MAKKKKENTLLYMQMPLPEGRKYSRTAKIEWNGLNKRQTLDSGDLSAEMNISTEEAPCLVPSPLPKELNLLYERPIGMFAFEDFIFVMYIDSVVSSYRTYHYNGKKEVNDKTEGKALRSAVMVDYIRKYTNEDGTINYNKTYTGIIKLCDELDVDEAYKTEKNIYSCYNTSNCCFACSGVASEHAMI